MKAYQLAEWQQPPYHAIKLALHQLVPGARTLGLDAKIVARGGAVMVIGVAGGTLPYTFNSLPSDASLAHPYWGSSIELAEVLELALAGHITAHAEQFGLERVEEAYQRMPDGALSGRAVITPNG